MKKTTKSQSEYFIEAARDAGCNEDEAAFDEALKRIAKAKPPKVKKSESESPICRIIVVLANLFGPYQFNHLLRVLARQAKGTSRRLANF